ncbi:carboxypeptidase-like regulatory domain-containing protein [Sphingobacterium sp. DR205]|uniref:carboxypeptidase-like regulatory domain-containing protein n=1 Tax=Sphingobacterium sp. DR205 TaxID=2713573 RepID=UPI0013E42D4D|nr:carboxypeptidase-like regulatory domain-containing protein [Sphingobacterium sp. DR205]QIH33711.1 carboxypeptidase-like regulatory domain-containing protein [Sphingobacterium sp. DR205]
MLFAQIRIIDSLSGEPVPSVNIYTEDGTLLGVADTKGEIALDSLRKNANSVLILQHISYNNYQETIGSLRKEKLVKLIPRSIKIDEIAIADKSKYDYLILKGYFRNTTFFNKRARYFYDGIIAYYIPLKDKKGKVYHRVLDYRIYEDSLTTRNFKEVMGNFWSWNPHVMRMKAQSVVNDLPSKFVLVQDKEKKLIRTGNLNTGYIQKTTRGDVQVYFDIIPPNSQKEVSFFKLKGQQYTGVTMENYTETNLDKPEPSKLVSKVMMNVGAIKRGRKSEFVPFDFLSEFYTQERKFITKEEFKSVKKELTSGIWLDLKSRYANKFWLDNPKFGIPQLNPFIEKKFGKELLELK